MKTKLTRWAVCVVAVVLLAASSGCKTFQLANQNKLATVSTQSFELTACSEEEQGGAFAQGTILLLSVPERSGREYQRQWYTNGQQILGENGRQLTVYAEPSSVGFYTCTVLETKRNDKQKHWTTTPFEVQVYSFGRAAARPEQVMPARTGAGPYASATNPTPSGVFTLTASPVVSTGTKNAGGCPGAYSSYVNFRKTIAAGWGWKLDSAATSHGVGAPQTASAIEYIDKTGTKYLCTPGSTASVNQTTAEPFRFTVYFPVGTAAPTSCSISLTGFLQ